MSDNTTITREQLRTVVITTELGGGTGDSDHFSYAKLGKSTYSFGQLQFDVGHSDSAKDFLKENGFDAADITNLSQHGGLSRKELDALDTKLQAIPQAKMDRFTNDQLDKTIASVGDVINGVRKQNPAAADAIAKDPKLQLGIADYKNQFGSIGSQFVGFLAGKEETIKNTGVTVQAGNPPTREDVQKFISATPYGHNKANARGVAGREERFNEAMGELKLGPVIKASGHTAGGALKLGSHGEAVSALQSDLGALGYTDNRGRPLQPDTHFGPSTDATVRAFQGDHGLPADGVAGPKTLDAIHSERQALINGIPALAPELEGLHPKHAADALAPAVQARDPHARALPDAAAPSINPYANPSHPDHGMYAELKQRIPDASDNRLAQLTAACHMGGMESGNVGDIHIGKAAIVIAPNGGRAGGAEVALTSAPPSIQQTVQNVQSHDQTVQVQLAQMNAQQQTPGPSPGGPGGGRMG